MDSGAQLVARARRRISVALVAMAVLPLLVASLLPGLGAAAFPQHTSTLDAAGQSIAATFSAQLRSASRSLTQLASRPAVAAVAGGTASSAQLADARSALLEVDRALGSTIGQISIVSGRGVERLVVAGGAVVPRGAPPAARASNQGTTGQPADLGVPIAGTGGTGTVGAIQAVLDLGALLAAAPPAPGDGAYAMVVDARSGQVLADSRLIGAGTTGAGTTGVAQGTGAGGAGTTGVAQGTGAGTTPGRGTTAHALPIVPQIASVAATTLTRSRQAWERFLGGGWDVGLAAIGWTPNATGSTTTGAGPVSAASGSSAHGSAVAATPAWSVVVVAPSPAPPLTPLVVGALLVALLVALGVWLARRALWPAEELEASRSQLISLYESARVDALYDALTSLGNHRAFQEEVDRQVEASLRYGPPVALLLIDLDEFKSVNDSSGHAAGDELLAQMGRLLQATIRRVDRAFRIGGDEFAVLMPHTDADGAAALARRLLSSALAPERRVDGRAFSFSGGISVAPTLATSRDELYAQADAALYWCKRHGRTTIEVYDRERIGELVDEHHSAELSAAVARAAAGRLLRAVFQPIVELPTGQVVGIEGLVRPTAESGFSSAGSLFAAAHASGRTIELDRACLDVVVAGAAALPPDCMISLNLSPRTLEAPEFNAAFLHNLLIRHGIAPGRVVIELTEREDVEDVDRLRRSVDACRALGIRVAADDVGSGNAGLRLLSQLHFDIVKVDLSLVQGGAGLGAAHESATAVVRSLADLARRWGALVIAEGIETPEQLRLVRDLGLNAAQGYLLARPSDAPRLEPLDLDALAAEDDWLHRMARVSPWPAPTAG